MLDIKFARSDDVNVAYHIVGDGPVDIVYVQGAWSHLEVFWELPAYRRFCELLGEFAGHPFRQARHGYVGSCSGCDSARGSDG